MQLHVDSMLHWVADDTEESIVGADWHQEAIVNLWTGLERVARAAALPWHVGNQLTLVAWHPDGTPWRPIPDLMLHPLAGPQRRTEMEAQRDGIPALLVEVASRSTWHIDVETDPTARDGAKAYEYLALGVTEYLVFEPSGEFLPGQVRAWRLTQGQALPWQPDRQGRYHSREGGIAFVPEGLFLRIIDHAGHPVLFNHELTDRLSSLDRQRQEAEARAQQESARAAQEARQRQEAEAEVMRLRAELDRLHGGSDAGHLPEGVACSPV